MRAWKMLYVLFGLMAAVLCVVRATPRAAAVAKRPNASSMGASARTGSRPQVATGSLAPLAADPRHSRGDSLARQLNSGGSSLSPAVPRRIRGSYAQLAADALQAEAGDWVERFIEPEMRDTQPVQSRRAMQPRQPLGTWIGWSGCSPYAARRDHLGRTQTVTRASLSFRSPPASPRANLPVVLPARPPLRQR